MRIDEFRDWSHRAADWGADYRRDLAGQPVRAPLDPGSTLAQLPMTPPDAPEPMEAIFRDFEEKIVPGLTHWQHPRFFAYFPANAAPVSVALMSAVAPAAM